MSIEISVCICTYKRPELLAELLEGLQQQDRNTPDFEVVIVDNDAACSGKPVADRYARTDSLSLTYISEPEKNISLARNRAVAAARGTWLALIDDDEQPSESWLLRLHETARQYSAAVVMGPVVPRFPDDAPQWMVKGHFFERPRHATGAPVPYMDVRTSNLFMNRMILRALPGPFDLRFGLTGGEDVMLLEQLRVRGHRMLWCDEATVEETVPEDRLRASWLLRRAYRGAQNYMEVHRLLGRTPLARLLRSLDIFCRACLLALLSGLLALFCLLLGRAHSFFWLCKAAAQAGKLSALFGGRYKEYA